MRDPSNGVHVIWHLLTLILLFNLHLIIVADEIQYDYTAYTECKSEPEAPLYNGGILMDGSAYTQLTSFKTATGFYSPAFLFYNLTESTRYSFSCWVKIGSTNSTVVKARLTSDNKTSNCIGTTIAQSGCWSFLKGGFVLDASSKTSVIYFQNTNFTQNSTVIAVKSVSLQQFSEEQWNLHQEDSIRQNRKRSVVVHVAGVQGGRIAGANISIQQISKDFPFGSAIAKTILGNQSYQEWFVERFNAAVFENELKWYATEPVRGKVNYTIADMMLEFIHKNQITVRGHNIFWENPKVTPSWVRNLTGDDLRAAVESRIQSLLSRYKGDFVHWDVNNEMLHFNFYEQRLGPNATLDFFRTAMKVDPLATLFMNEFSVVETCEDVESTVDSYIMKLKELNDGPGPGFLEGIGLQGHFAKPNIPLMRAILDKLATLQLPIWLTEVDISKKFDQLTQAIYLEEVLREGFSHPSVSGIILWTPFHEHGCYQMCLTDGSFKNLPAGDVVDRLLREWQTEEIKETTDDHGSFNFTGFLGEYKVTVTDGNMSTTATFSLDRSDETKHINIQMSMTMSGSAKSLEPLGYCFCYLLLIGFLKLFVL